jgi:hypothetical protein
MVIVLLQTDYPRRNDDGQSFLALAVIVLIIAIVWRGYSYFEFEAAKDAFRDDPENAENRSRLISTAR